MLIGVIFGILASFTFGRYLLENFPGVFSLGYVTKAGPPKERAEGSFFKMTIKVSLQATCNGILMLLRAGLIHLY